MYIYSIFLNATFGIISLLPIMVLFHFQLLKRDRNAGKKAPLPHIVGAYVFCYGLLSILSATGISSARIDGLQVKLNLIPFDDIRTNGMQYVYNILLFVPLGFLLPMLWKPFERWTRTVACGLLLSLSIEILQLFNHRATDIDDLLMNTAGTAIGYLLFVLLKRRFPQIAIFTIDCGNHWKWEPYSYLFLAYLVMFTVQPLVGRRLLNLLF